MTYSQFDINTPSPYLLLNKNTKIPTILSVGESNSNSTFGIETDVKIVTAHKCQSETLITRLTSSAIEDFVIPTSFLAKKLASITDYDAIKLGSLTEGSIKLLDKKTTKTFIPIIISGNELDKVTYSMIKENITKRSTLFVCNSDKVQNLMDNHKDLVTVEDAFEMANELVNNTKTPNVLITNCLRNKNSSIDVLYMDDNQTFIVYKGKIFAPDADSMISAAVASNLANGYSIQESVYGAIEYVQSSISTRNSRNDAPNFMHAIEVPMMKMIKDECFTARELVHIPYPIKSGPIIENFYKYLIKHPLVEPYWNSYINHEFVKQIADGTLPLKKFRFFVEQDYSYLIDYGRVHCIAGSKSPELQDMEQELVIVGRIREEMGQHEKRLREEFGITDNEYFKNIKRGPALNNYSRYFNDVAKRGNWQELVAALTPCMMGYGAAAMQYKGKVCAPKGGMYAEWIDIYSCDSYENGMEIGENLLNHIARTYPADQIERLIRIFGEVCDLETKFWDAALEYE